jgi:predicted Zn-dependent peptidase
MTYQLTTLDNGLRVASERQENCLTAAFAIAVNVGARYEEPKENGLSHLLEHMAFKGTATKNAKQIAEAFDLMGGNVNAYTSHEHTVYYAKVLAEYAEDALELLCDIITNSVFDAGELEREREVVLQEIAMHHDTPDDLVYDLFQQMAFKDQALGCSILGPKEQVANYSRDDLLQYVNKHYTPTRMALAGSGAVNHAAMEQAAKKFFANATAHAAPHAATTAQYVGGEKTLEKELEQVQLVVGFPGISATDEDYYAAQVFVTILGGGMSSRLFQEVRERRGLAYSVSAFLASYQEIGVVAMAAGTTVEHLAELTGALREVLASIQQGVGDEELLRAKNQLKANVVMTRESTGSIAEWIARHLLVYDRYKPAEELLAEIERVTAADMVRLAKQCLSGVPTIAALGPEGSVNHAALTQKLAA